LPISSEHEASQKGADSAALVIMDIDIGNAGSTRTLTDAGYQIETTGISDAYDLETLALAYYLLDGCNSTAWIESTVARLRTTGETGPEIFNLITDLCAASRREPQRAGVQEKGRP
jgi:hypothetical protein